MEILACILGFLVVIILVYRDWSVYLSTFAGLCVVVLLSGSDFMTAMTETYTKGVFTAINSFLFMLMFGCVQSSLYRESGAAYSIASTIMHKLIREDTSNTAKNIIALSIIMVIGTLLSMGGIIAGVVIVLMYPIALAIFEHCDIPKRFILGVLGASAYTFTLTLPGSPEVTNVAAMSVLKTSSTVAAIPGIVGAVVEVVVILLVMNALINHARHNGDHFQRHPEDPYMDETSEKPPFFLSLIPLFVLFVLFNFFNLHIVLCLIFSCLLSIVLFWKWLKPKDVKHIVCQATVDSIPMTLNVGAICGFAAIITNSDAFQTILDTLTSIEASPILICAVVVAIMCMLTGGSSTGQLIALPIIAPRLMEMGLSVDIIHRVSVFAATTLDSMPYSGSILMLLPMCHMKLKEIYPAMFITTVLATTCGTIAVCLMCFFFPGLT